MTCINRVIYKLWTRSDEENVKYRHLYSRGHMGTITLVFQQSVAVLRLDINPSQCSVKLTGWLAVCRQGQWG